MKQVDVIVPVYQPNDKLAQLLDMLLKQTVQINRIILINTEEAYFSIFLIDHEWKPEYQDIILKHIHQKEFDHGKTRNYGVSLSESPYFIMMTDDAVPDDEKMIENLLSAFDNPEVGMAYARQIPGRNSGAIERFTRSFNYSDEEMIKGKEDIQKLGIKAFFASNVCAAYRRDVFDRLGGFINRAIFNEDMIYARKLIDHDYKIAYVPSARVVHSHNYTGNEQFKRNFDLGVSHADHPEVFDGIDVEEEGVKLVQKTCIYLLKIFRPWLILKLLWHSLCKYMGYFCGKRYQKISPDMMDSFSMNRSYWRNKQN